MREVGYSQWMLEMRDICPLMRQAELWALLHVCSPWYHLWGYMYSTQLRFIRDVVDDGALDSSNRVHGLDDQSCVLVLEAA